MLVVGDATTLKVHVHTDEPERATAVFAEAGEVSRLDVADMRLQVSERERRLGDGADGVSAAGRDGWTERPAASERERPADAAGGRPAAAGARVRCGAVAVVSGDGLRAMFEELGVHTIDGGPTLNPSTYDLLAAIHEVQAEEVVRAAELGERDHGGRARGRAVGQAGARGARHQPAGRSRRGGRAGVRADGRGERARAERGARAPAHGRGRAGRAR